ncbi:MAG: type 1 glutamine amidotransferase [Acidimicrobiales bacterium]
MTAGLARCVVVQHLEPEGPYLVADALGARGVRVETCRTDLGHALPARAGDVEGLVVMGGPMSATSDEGFPTRRAEIALLAEAVRAGVPVLGICLGAQLLAAACGGTVRRGDTGPEIGWGPVRLARAAAEDPLLHGLPDELTVLHWHGDTFDPGPGSVLLASSERYRSQAFRAGTAAWGLQFHLEVGALAVERFVDEFGDEARALPGGAEAILGGAAGALEALRPHATAVLDRFAALVAGRQGALD